MDTCAWQPQHHPVTTVLRNHFGTEYRCHFWRKQFKKKNLKRQTFLHFFIINYAKEWIIFLKLKKQTETSYVCMNFPSPPRKLYVPHTTFLDFQLSCKITKMYTWLCSINSASYQLHRLWVCTLFTSKPWWRWINSIKGTVSNKKNLRIILEIKKNTFQSQHV